MLGFSFWKHQEEEKANGDGQNTSTSGHVNLTVAEGHPVLGVLLEFLKGMGRERRKIKGNREKNLWQMQ